MRASGQPTVSTLWSPATSRSLAKTRRYRSSCFLPATRSLSRPLHGSRFGASASGLITIRASQPAQWARAKLAGICADRGARAIAKFVNADCSVSWHLHPCVRQLVLLVHSRTLGILRLRLLPLSFLSAYLG